MVLASLFSVKATNSKLFQVHSKLDRRASIRNNCPFDNATRRCRRNWGCSISRSVRRCQTQALARFPRYFWICSHRRHALCSQHDFYSRSHRTKPSCYTLRRRLRNGHPTLFARPRCRAGRKLLDRGGRHGPACHAAQTYRRPLPRPAPAGRREGPFRLLPPEHRHLRRRTAHLGCGTDRPAPGAAGGRARENCRAHAAVREELPHSGHGGVVSLLAAGRIATDVLL
mmetsp:Transcript_13227/g.26410  ORF Transcript_13227/g.26410 Transcript_13227/m.26410 type:complete len:227 (-) Transcript_13227:504-1184(-)